MVILGFELSTFQLATQNPDLCSNQLVKVVDVQNQYCGCFMVRALAFVKYITLNYITIQIETLKYYSDPVY